MRPTLAGFKRAASAVLVVGLLSSVLLGGEFHLQLKTRTVYIVPMANGLDCHLASRLTSSGVAKVVLDPDNAYAVLTDRVDEAFWAWSKAQYKRTAQPSNGGWFIDDDRFTYQRPRMGGYRGTVFLVDPRNGVVLWSHYEPAAYLSPNSLDHVAERVAANLKESLSPK
jgi:hypothetical protein